MTRWFLHTFCCLVVVLALYFLVKCEKFFTLLHWNAKKIFRKNVHLDLENILGKQVIRYILFVFVIFVIFYFFWKTTWDFQLVLTQENNEMLKRGEGTKPNVLYFRWNLVTKTWKTFQPPLIYIEAFIFINELKI